MKEGNIQQKLIEVRNREQENLRKTPIERNWNIKASTFAVKTINPIRNIVQNLKVEPNPEKSFIPLSIGDPTVFGNLNTAQKVTEAVKNVLVNGKHNGYSHSAGSIEARQAVCDYVEKYQGKVSPDDIILSSGCGAALEMCINVFAEPGKNILIPRPAFPIYWTFAISQGMEVRPYNLLPERQWEADLEQMEELIDENTSVIVLTNPSNPCGSVFSVNHIQDIVSIAEKYCVPIITDEVYEDIVFPNVEYHSVSSLSKNVPVLSCGGLSKRFLVPGWRFGWIVIHDRNNIFQDVRKGLSNLSNRIIGPNTLIQGALPEILKNTPESFFENLSNTLYKNAKLAYDVLSDILGLKPIMPDGAMYMMIGIDIDNFPEYESDMDFVEALVSEQSVFCLPGQCFDYPNYIRIVITVPEDKIWEACTRIADFCNRHYKNVFNENLIDKYEW